MIWWLTVSKNFESSIKIPNVSLPLSKFWAISRVNCNIACSVELLNWKPNWSVVYNISFQIYHLFFKNWNNVCDFKFFRKDWFFKRCLKNFEENALYRIADIHKIIKTITTNDLVSFESLECFSEFLRRKFFMLHRSSALR